MRKSRPKTQCMDFNIWHDYKYLGSGLEETGGMATYITQRVGAVWRNLKRCSGVLCDRRMPVSETECMVRFLQNTGQTIDIK